MSRLCSVKSKSFQERFEDEPGGTWISVSKQSRGVVFSLGFEKEEVGWLLEHLGKVVELKSFMGFNKKYIGKTRVHLLEVSFNKNGEILIILCVPN